MSGMQSLKMADYDALKKERQKAMRKVAYIEEREAKGR